MIYLTTNFPANQIIDSRGLRFSFLMGSGLSMVGCAFYILINKNFYFMILGYTILSLGQAFIVNCPAKIATYWFFDNNVKINTYIETFRYCYNDWINADRILFWICATHFGGS